jgi:hypothetical protein
VLYSFACIVHIVPENWGVFIEIPDGHLHFTSFTIYLFFFTDGDFSRSFVLVLFPMLGIAFVLNRFW